MSLRTDAFLSLLALVLSGTVGGCQFEAPRSQPVIPVVPAKTSGQDSSVPLRSLPAPPSAGSTVAAPVSRVKEGGVELASAGTSSPATEDKLHDLYQQATNRYAKIGSYIARFRRQEQVSGKDRPEELVVFKFRKEPYSVYMKWIGTEGKGREVAYVKGRYEDKIHTLLAAGDVPLMPAGKQFSIPVDSPLVQANSRYSLTEAGIGALIERFRMCVSSAGQSDTAVCLVYKGKVKRPEYERPLEEVDQTMVPGTEALFPQGGTRQWYFDPASHLPMIVIAQDRSGHQVEYYCYDQLLAPVGLDDEDFNPANLGKTNR